MYIHKRGEPSFTIMAWNDWRNELVIFCSRCSLYSLRPTTMRKEVIKEHTWKFYQTLNHILSSTLECTVWIHLTLLNGKRILNQLNEVDLTFLFYDMSTTYQEKRIIIRFVIKHFTLNGSTSLNPLFLTKSSIFRIGRVEESALRELRKLIYSHKDTLLQAFRKYDTEHTGKMLIHM